jgi:hypothetical protein
MRVALWFLWCVGCTAPTHGEPTQTTSLSNNNHSLEPPIILAESIHPTVEEELLLAPDAVFDWQQDDHEGVIIHDEESRAIGKLGMIGNFQNNNKDKDAPKPKQRIQRAFEAFRKNAHLEDSMVGTRLVSSSFRLLATAAGISAAVVRVSGDAAATIMRSPVKLVGTAIKSVGGGLNKASHRIEPGKESYASNDHDKPASRYSTSRNRSRWLLKRRRNEKSKERSKSQKFVKRTQTAAAKSIRILGTAVNGMGETLVLVGMAAEFLATSTASVAEATVRLVEDVTGTISVAIFLRGEQRKRRKNRVGKNNEPSRNLFMPRFLSLGVDPDADFSSQEAKRTLLLEKLQEQWLKEPSLYHSWELLEVLAFELAEFGRNVSADVEGVSSMASELAAALLLCYLAALLLLYRGPGKTVNDSEELEKRLNKWQQKDVLVLKSHGAKSLCSRILVAWTDREFTSITQFACLVLRWCLGAAVKVPCIMLHFSAKLVFRVLWSRPMFLLLFHGLIWFYLSRQYQNRALMVQR